MAEFVSIIGRLRRIARPGGGTPEHPIAPPEEETDPDYGIGEERPSHPIALPKPPPGIWPPPVPEHPIVPIPPGEGGTPENPIVLPPGMIWPPNGGPEVSPPVTKPTPPATGTPTPPIAGGPSKFLVLVYIPGYGAKYVVVDPSLRPTPKR